MDSRQRARHPGQHKAAVRRQRQPLIQIQRFQFTADLSFDDRQPAVLLLCREDNRIVIFPHPRQPLLQKLGKDAVLVIIVPVTFQQMIEQL